MKIVGKSAEYNEGFNAGIAVTMPELNLLRALLGNPTPEGILKLILKKSGWKSKHRIIQKSNK